MKSSDDETQRESNPSNQESPSSSCGFSDGTSHQSFSQHETDRIEATEKGPEPFEVSPEIEGPRSDSGPRAGTEATSQKTRCVARTYQTSVHRIKETPLNNRRVEELRYGSSSCFLSASPSSRSPQRKGRFAISSISNSNHPQVFRTKGTAPFHQTREADRDILTGRTSLRNGPASRPDSFLRGVAT